MHHDVDDNQKDLPIRNLAPRHARAFESVATISLNFGGSQNLLEVVEVLGGVAKSFETLILKFQILNFPASVDSPILTPPAIVYEHHLFTAPIKIYFYL